ncbi:MAG: hypothetical protein JJT99_05215 [Rhodobacteraceae bacterium]|nr:hypothetical protein [Paracoccaceae bacterium]
MIRFGMILAAALALAAPAAGQCYADYKAKQDNPLRLQYGIVELPDNACTDRARAQAHVAQVVARSGWTLLQLESIFGPAEFQARQSNAGVIHLRR